MADARRPWACPWCPRCRARRPSRRRRRARPPPRPAAGASELVEAEHDGDAGGRDDRRHRRQEGGVGDEDPRARVPQHRGQVRAGQPRIEGYRHRADAEGAEEGRGPFEAVGQEQGHAVLRAHAARPEAGGDAPGEGEEIGIRRGAAGGVERGPQAMALRDGVVEEGRGRVHVSGSRASGRGRAARTLDGHARGHQAVLDPVELVAAVRMRLPEGVEAREAGEVAQAGLRGLGHRHLARLVALHALRGLDPEPLGRLLGEEPRRLPRRHRGQEEARGEADGARGRRDEVREIAERRHVEIPVHRGEEIGEPPRLGHEGLTHARDQGGDRGLRGGDGPPLARRSPRRDRSPRGARARR